jgi:hypothetical protein
VGLGARSTLVPEGVVGVATVGAGNQGGLVSMDVRAAAAVAS